MVTATRDRRREPDLDLDVTSWGQRSAFGSVKGWPWWASLLLALGLSIIGAIIDMNSSGDLGKIFEAAYFIGCVGAVCMVRRRNLFGPTVQAPLILAVTIPVVVLVTKGLPAGSGTMSKLLALGVPLVTGFPTMAVTTGATVVIGAIRWLAQRKPAGVDDEDADWTEVGDEPKRKSASRDGRTQSAPRKPRPSSSSRSDRSDRDRPARDDRGAPRERSRSSQSQARSRSEAPDRGGRSSSGRSGSAKPAASGKSAGGRSSDRDRDRGQTPRGSQSRDRGQQPRRSSRDEGRRQPPRRRDDDDF